MLGIRIFVARYHGNCRICKIFYLRSKALLLLGSLHCTLLNIGMRQTLNLLCVSILASPFTFTATVFVPKAIILSHIFVDFCLELMNHHLHFSPFEIKLRRFFLCLILYFYYSIINIRYFIWFLIIRVVLSTLSFSGGAFFGFFQLNLHSLLRLLQFLYLVFKIQDVQM